MMRIPKLITQIFLACLVIIVLPTGIPAQQEPELSTEQKVQKAKEHYLSGKQLIQQGNYSAADEEFKKAQQLLKESSSTMVSSKTQPVPLPSPENPDLHYNLAVEYLKTNQFMKASEAFKRVIQLNPKDKDAYYNLGVLYESYLGDKNQAIFYYTRYIKLASPIEDTSQLKAWIRQIKAERKRK